MTATPILRNLVLVQGSREPPHGYDCDDAGHLHLTWRGPVADVYKHDDDQLTRETPTETTAELNHFVTHTARITGCTCQPEILGITDRRFGYRRAHVQHDPRCSSATS